MPTSAQARPIRRRWPMRIRTTNITNNVSPGPASSSTPRARTTSSKNSRDPESRRQVGHGGAEGRGQRQGRNVPLTPYDKSALGALVSPVWSRPCARPGASRQGDYPVPIRCLSQCRRRRPPDRPGLRADGARPVGDLRRRARRQFRPWRDDDRSRCISRSSLFSALAARSVGHDGADCGASVRARLCAAGGA